MNIEKKVFNAIISEIDKINNEDPNIIDSLPRELIYSKRMIDTLLKYNPDAEDDLKVAVYGQHIKRWAYPRSEYPEGRAGYLKWRQDLYKIHAALVFESILDAGGEQGFADSVKDIMVNKVSGKGNSQLLEDTACLVFLEYYLDEFINKHTEDKLISIIKKTWSKMSSSAHDAALKIPFTDKQSLLINKVVYK